MESKRQVQAAANEEEEAFGLNKADRRIPEVHTEVVKRRNHRPGGGVVCRQQPGLKPK